MSVKAPGLRLNVSIHFNVDPYIQAYRCSSSSVIYRFIYSIISQIGRVPIAMDTYYSNVKQLGRINNAQPVETSDRYGETRSWHFLAMYTCTYVGRVACIRRKNRLENGKYFIEYTQDMTYFISRPSLKAYGTFFRRVSHILEGTSKTRKAIVPMKGRRRRRRRECLSYIGCGLLVFVTSFLMSRLHNLSSFALFSL